MTAKPVRTPSASRSGPSSTYSERVARGMPNKTYVLTDRHVEDLEALVQSTGRSASELVREAIDLLVKKHRR